MVFYDPQFCFLLEFMINDKALITEKKKKKKVILMLIDMIGKNEITGVKNILIKEQISSVLKFIRVCFWVFFKAT